MSHRTIRLKDWAKLPSGRYRDHGPHAGEVFREDVLLPALRANDSVTLDMNDVYGLPSSWMEEVFGGLVRANKLSPEWIRRRLDLSLNAPLCVSEIHAYIADAK